MKYKDFIKDVKRSVEQKVADRDAQVEIRRIVKANDCARDGLVIMEKGLIAYPTLYLQDFYPLFQNGETIEEIAERIIEIHDHCVMPPLEYSDLESFEIAKEHLTCKLYNTTANEEYLEDAVSISFFDLSVVFYCTMILDGEHVFSSKVTQDLLEKWGLHAGDLFETARDNTEKMLGVFLKEVGEFFPELYGQGTEEQDEFFREILSDDRRIPMYILSNQTRRFGAVNMLDYRILQQLSEQLEDDLYIIPSSVHEVILTPVRGGFSREAADEMVREVNRNVLDIADILADHIYLYSREENRITV